MEWRRLGTRHRTRSSYTRRGVLSLWWCCCCVCVPLLQCAKQMTCCCCSLVAARARCYWIKHAPWCITPAAEWMLSRSPGRRSPGLIRPFKWRTCHYLLGPAPLTQSWLRTPPFIIQQRRWKVNDTHWFWIGLSKVCGEKKVSLMDGPDPLSFSVKKLLISRVLQYA
jgi:hypothetical protein